ncbi:unnamed protein product [Rhizophagus irregularis]|nr:unnamed protein product [Rhizophagus irregularis]
MDKVNTDIKNGDPNFHYMLKSAVTFIQKRKSNNNGSKRLNQGKKSKSSFENIENIDPQTIPPRRKRTIKKKHVELLTGDHLLYELEEIVLLSIKYCYNWRKCEPLEQKADGRFLARLQRSHIEIGHLEMSRYGH